MLWYDSLCAYPMKVIPEKQDAHLFKYQIFTTLTTDTTLF